MNRSERDEERERLKALTGREVDFRTVDCDCNGDWAYCPNCLGTGSYPEAYFLFCNHPVVDGPDVECEENGCADKERSRNLLEQRVEAA